MNCHDCENYAQFYDHIGAGCKAYQEILTSDIEEEISDEGSCKQYREKEKESAK